MKKALFILVFVLAMAITPLIVWDNPAFADFYGDLRRALGISQGYNADGNPVPNFANGYQIAGSDITTTEAAYLDGVTIGAVAANKAVVVDGDKDIEGFRNVSWDGTWQISGTTVSSSAADLNKLDTISATGGVIVAERIAFTETADSGTYTATCVLPANSILGGIVPGDHVNWGADTSAALTAGYTGAPTAFANAENVKTGAPTLAGFTEPVFFASGTTITFTVAAVDATGTGGAGRDNFLLQYAVVTPIAATKS